MRFARDERLAMAGLMAETGPGAPTLCEGWTVRDLLAHLLLRDRRPDAAAGILIKRFAAHTEKVQQKIAAGDFAELLGKLRNPPWWSPLSYALLDEPVNLTEMFVHHEDVRRVRQNWNPRQLSNETQQALWKAVSFRAKLALKRFPASIRLESPGFGSIQAGAGGPEKATLSGAPGELLLFVFGRQQHARVTVEAPAPLADRLSRSRLGI
jgi:uncharacterized protein (TIGR03085 family)